MTKLEKIAERIDSFRDEMVDLQIKLCALPAISPDGRLVAYTAGDGIYVVSVEGGKSRRVVEACVELRREPDGHIWWDRWPPVPSWSPDGQWLVYHRCMRHCSLECSKIEHYSVFKMNVETREEVLLVEGGLNPYWRLESPVASP